MDTTKAGTVLSEWRPCPEMLSTVSDPNLEVHHLTTEPGASAWREGFFTPDSRRFIFQRRWAGAGNQYLMCELDEGFRLRALTDSGTPVSAPAVSPDSQFLYYYVDETHLARPRLVLNRLSLDTFVTETLTVIDHPVDGIGRRPCAGGQPLRGLSRSASMRADGKSILVGANFAGPDGADHFAPFYVNLDTLHVHAFDWEPYSWRVGGAYFPGPNPAHLTHALFGRANRSQHWDEKGQYTERWYSETHRASVHVVDEQGSIVGTVPIGGKGEGVDHPGWRGGRYEVVTHTSDTTTAPHWRGVILCAEPVACAPADRDLGKDIPGPKRRFELTRKIRRPDVCHHSWSLSGKHMVADTEGWQGRGTPCPQGPAAYLYLGTVIEPENEDPYLVPKYLLHPRSSWNGAYTENVPVLSPDGRTVVFLSDWLGKVGTPQLFAVRGFEFPHS